MITMVRYIKLITNLVHYYFVYMLKFYNVFKTITFSDQWLNIQWFEISFIFSVLLLILFSSYPIPKYDKIEAQTGVFSFEEEKLCIQNIWIPFKNWACVTSCQWQRG